jgi:hypothetical protein
LLLSTTTALLLQLGMPITLLVNNGNWPSSPTQVLVSLKVQWPSGINSLAVTAVELAPLTALATIALSGGLELARGKYTQTKI